MKIFGADNNINQAKVDEMRNRDRAAPSKSGSGGEKQSAPAAKTSETVSVSGMAREVGKIKSAVKEAPDIRREKVEAIKAKIEKGDYHISGEKIAGKIIEDIIKQGK